MVEMRISKTNLWIRNYY